MTDKVQKIRKEIERIQLYSQSETLKQVLDYIDEVQEEPVSEELIDVAKQYVKEHVIGIDKVTFSIATDMFISGAKWQKQKDSMFINEDLEKASYLFACKCHPLKTECSTSSPNREVIEAFKTGAKWQKKQMMRNTIDAQCFGFQGAALFSFRLPADNYLAGSKVKVIVIKED